MPVLEHALLPVRAGQEAAFEAALAEARPLIAASPGFIAMSVRRPADGTGGAWLLLVEWRSIAMDFAGLSVISSGGRCCILSMTLFPVSFTSENRCDD